MEVYEAIKSDLYFIVFAICIIQLVYMLSGYGVDSTDKDKYNRSDMKLYTDYETGLQYLSTRNGNLIPRLDRDGKHMIKKD